MAIKGERIEPDESNEGFTADEIEAGIQDTKEMRKKKLEYAREDATELQTEVAGDQAIVFETTVLTLMRRSAKGEKNNTELVNALAGFLQALEKQANYGNGKEPFPPGHAKDIELFLGESAKALNYKVGVEPVSGLGVETPDFSKWEKKKGK